MNTRENVGFNKKRDGGRRIITFVTLTTNIFLSYQQPKTHPTAAVPLDVPAPGFLALLTLPLRNNKYAGLFQTTKEM